VSEEQTSASEPTEDAPKEGKDEAPKEAFALATGEPAEQEQAPKGTVEPAPIAPGVPRLGVPVGAAAVPPELSPGYGFLAVISLASLVADLATKVWAKEKLETFPGYITVWEKKWQTGSAGVSFILAHNKGGAWGLLQGTNENVRKPFFLLVSAAAIAFIVTLFRRLQPSQRALKWGLPLVLGGALGNVFDRIRYGSVIDFIDAHLEMRGVDHHWPTFNVADIAICVGVGLMAVDMFTSKRTAAPPVRRHVPAQKSETAVAAESPSASETKAETAGEATADTISDETAGKAAATDGSSETKETATD
jgi:signal peptidase II